jgi:hypothetical protein
MAGELRGQFCKLCTTTEGDDCNPVGSPTTSLNHCEVEYVRRLINLSAAAIIRLSRKRA